LAEWLVRRGREAQKGPLRSLKVFNDELGLTGLDRTFGWPADPSAGLFPGGVQCPRSVRFLQRKPRKKSQRGSAIKITAFTSTKSTRWDRCHRRFFCTH